MNVHPGHARDHTLIPMQPSIYIVPPIIIEDWVIGYRSHLPPLKIAVSWPQCGQPLRGSFGILEGDSPNSCRHLHRKTRDVMSLCACRNESRMRGFLQNVRRWLKDSASKVVLNLAADKSTVAIEACEVECWRSPPTLPGSQEGLKTIQGRPTDRPQLHCNLQQNKS